MDEQTDQPKILQAIPGILASNVSIFVFIFLFIYLVVFGLIGLFVEGLAPSANMQLVLGNYTNVTSALGAAIAAGASTHNLSQMRKLHGKHEELKTLVESLHAKIDQQRKPEEGQELGSELGQGPGQQGPGQLSS